MESYQPDTVIWTPNSNNIHMYANRIIQRQTCGRCQSRWLQPMVEKGNVFEIENHHIATDA
eukprot:12416854-Karenia_brevis.AAC.1